MLLFYIVLIFICHLKHINLLTKLFCQIYFTFTKVHNYCLNNFNISNKLFVCWTIYKIKVVKISIKIYFLFNLISCIWRCSLIYISLHVPVAGEPNFLLYSSKLILSVTYKTHCPIHWILFTRASNLLKSFSLLDHCSCKLHKKIFMLQIKLRFNISISIFYTTWAQ